MRRITLTFLVGALLAASAAAQTPPNPVIEHFRAYRAAIAQGDLAAADTAATAALAASEARDGDGGRTAILALNLASLRLERGDRDGARAPAERAHTLATTRSDANVDPTLARLVLQRAELGSRSSNNRLRATIAELETNPDLASDLYLASADLGRADFNERRYEEAAAAWAMTGRLSHAAPDDPVIARAEALILEGSAYLYDSAEQGRDRLLPEDRLAHERFVEAARTLEGRITYEPNRPLREAARIAARARAWELTLRSRLSSLLVDIPWEDPAPLRVGNPNACAWRIDFTPRPEFPMRAAGDLRFGVAVSAIYINADGAIAAREVVAAAPDGLEFAQAVAEVLPQWSVERADPAASCEQTTVITATFSFRQPDTQTVLPAPPRAPLNTPRVVGRSNEQTTPPPVR